MSLAFRILYAIGLTPWDRDDIAMPVRELAEGPGALPPGRALDLGCGTGRHAVFLAQHGWDVTAVDFVPKALSKARHRAEVAGVRVRWIQGDVTRLAEIEVGDGYGLVLDIGTFHGLDDRQRADCAREVTAAAASGATMLVLAFQPGRRGPLPRGLDQAELLRHYGADWELISVAPMTGPPLPGPLRNAQPTWYRLRKR
jgi:SAM-dependent methyltransferase